MQTELTARAACLYHSQISVANITVLLASLSSPQLCDNGGLLKVLEPVNQEKTQRFVLARLISEPFAWMEMDQGWSCSFDAGSGLEAIL